MECGGAGGETVPGEGHPPRHRQAPHPQAGGQGRSGGRGEVTHDELISVWGNIEMDIKRNIVLQKYRLYNGVKD